MATTGAAQPSGSRAPLAESTPAIPGQAHQQPIAKPGAPGKLDEETLQMALNAVLLSGLAYKTPREVEYLRLRAQKGVSQDQATKEIEKQAGGTRPKDLPDATVVKLEAENNVFKYTDILSQFDEPSQYFDGRQSLFMDTTEAYVFFCPTPEGQRNVLYCAFRGTSDDGDKLADLDFAQVQINPVPLSGDNPIENIKNIKIHRGFRDQFVAVSTALTRNVEAAGREVQERGAAIAPGPPTRMADMVKAKVAEESKKAARPNDGGFEVVVTGHSLGAALATIGAFVAKLEHPNVRVRFFGFGSPRVGNGNFVDAFNRVLPRDCVHHFANQYDPVTGIPGALFFRHVPGIVVLREEGNKAVRAMPLQDETAGLRSTEEWLWSSAEFVNWWVWKQVGKVPWSQHQIGLYMTRVRALVDQAKAGK